MRGHVRGYAISFEQGVRGTLGFAAGCVGLLFITSAQLQRGSQVTSEAWSEV